MTEQLRPDVVSAIVAASTANLPDVISVESPTPAELHAAGDLLTAMSQSELQQSGALQPSRSVLDLDLQHVQTIAAVWGVLSQWSGLPDRLSDALKVLPADVARDVYTVLALGGLVDPATVPEPDG